MSGLTDTQVDAIASAATDLIAALRRVVDVQAHGEPSPSPTGTSSAGDGAGSASPAAPSTQPTPQVGDVWERNDERYRIVTVFNRNTHRYFVERLTLAGPAEPFSTPMSPLDKYRLVERDGKPWPPAQESDPVAGVKPTTDEQIAELEHSLRHLARVGALPDSPLAESTAGLISRVRQEQARAEGWKGSRRDWEDRALDSERERDEAVARAEAAEAALARVERVTDLERAVVQAAWDWFHDYRQGVSLRAAVRALRDAQEEGQ